MSWASPTSCYGFWVVAGSHAPGLFIVINMGTHTYFTGLGGREFIPDKGFLLCCGASNQTQGLLKARKGGAFVCLFLICHTEIDSFPVLKKLHDTISDGINGIFFYYYGQLQHKGIGRKIGITYPVPPVITCTGSCLGDQGLKKGLSVEIRNEASSGQKAKREGPAALESPWPKHWGMGTITTGSSLSIKIRFRTISLGMHTRLSQHTPSKESSVLVEQASWLQAWSLTEWSKG